MEEGNELIEKGIGSEGEGGTALQAATTRLPSTEFVKVEKNLASLGFFTPSSKRLRNAQEKSFTITTVVDGKRMELKGTIIPSAKYGLPITADQDKWIALCKIITDILRKEGKVTNPIAFTSADILRLLHKHRHSGKNYREVEEWLDVLFSTTIFSEGVVYLSNEKRRVKDRYRVFDRAVSFGKEFSDGKIADKNYVWLSEWQLQNINSNYLLPIDLDAYRELKNHISKALVPLLQVWLFATRENGVFEKRYNELCEFLNIRQYRYLSLIVQTLGPSLNELTQFGYLADWRIENTSDDQGYKILFFHGEKFHRDRRERQAKKRIVTGDPEPQVPASTDTHVSHRTGEQVSARMIPASITQPERQVFDPNLVAEFTRRGITEKRAVELLANAKPGRDVIAQLEHADHCVKNSQTEIRNPAAYIARLIELNTPVPDGFETRAQRKALEDRDRIERARTAAREAEQQLEWDYEDYQEAEIDRYIEAHRDEFEAIKDTKRKADRERFSFTTESMAVISARNEIRRKIPLLTFEEFLDRRQQGPDCSLELVTVSPAADAAPALPEAQDVSATEPAGALSSDPAPAAAEPKPEIPQPMMIHLVTESLPPPNELDGSAPANLA